MSPKSKDQLSPATIQSRGVTGLSPLIIPGSQFCSHRIAERKQFWNCQQGDQGLWQRNQDTRLPSSPWHPHRQNSSFIAKLLLYRVGAHTPQAQRGRASFEGPTVLPSRRRCQQAFSSFVFVFVFSSEQSSQLTVGSFGQL